jgi:hypothetical protein
MLLASLYRTTQESQSVSRAYMNRRLNRPVGHGMGRGGADGKVPGELEQKNGGQARNAVPDPNYAE